MKRKMQYAAAAFWVVLLMSGCSGLNALIKSGNTDAIYARAMDYYRQEKWSRASDLFEHVVRDYAGTEREDSVSFYYAHCMYKNNNFNDASILFDEFRRKFGRSPFIEDAEGMYAMCFYFMSPPPTRDQAITTQAIVAVNEFMSRYPGSERVEQFRAIDRELTDKLHERAYLNAYTYYKIGRYKSAIVALKNALKLYPESRFREQIMFLIVDAGYRFASNSIEEKQTDRYLDMLDSSLSFREEFPESKHMKEVERMTERARDHLARSRAEEEANANNS